MNLPAQIGLITVPQEFTRLCNAILVAEHGNEYLPIDDDRSDRGNDGYLKSEKRLFAAHCFKRVQNQSIDADIRGKMVGDLGKAIALKKEGIWDIVAWTFLCNYKISEEIGARLIQQGQDADIEVSWRGPDELAAGIQKHQVVLDQFPDLQANKISTQLGDIHTSLAALASAVGQSATVVQVTRSPRMPEEQRQLLLSRPDGWEYLLFAGVLYQSSKALDGKLRDHELHLSRGPRKHLDMREATGYLKHTFDEVIGALAPMKQLFMPTAIAEAFGEPGEAGEPGRIEHFARRVAGMYEELLDWAATMRNLDVPDPLKRSMELASQFVDKPIEEFRAFIDRTVAETDRLPALLAAADPEPLTIRLELVVTADAELMAEFNQELKRATKEITGGG